MTMVAAASTGRGLWQPRTISVTLDTAVAMIVRTPLPGDSDLVGADPIPCDGGAVLAEGCDDATLAASALILSL